VNNREKEHKMRYRRLGDAGMKVSAVALGGWINYGEGKVAADAATSVVRRAYEREINFAGSAWWSGRPWQWAC